jgi:hypothetical protein
MLRRCGEIEEQSSNADLEEVVFKTLVILSQM